MPCRVAVQNFSVTQENEEIFGHTIWTLYEHFQHFRHQFCYVKSGKKDSLESDWFGISFQTISICGLNQIRKNTILCVFCCPDFQKFIWIKSGYAKHLIFSGSLNMAVVRHSSTTFFGYLCSYILFYLSIFFLYLLYLIWFDLCIGCKKQKIHIQINNAVSVHNFPTVYSAINWKWCTHGIGKMFSQKAL